MAKEPDRGKAFTRVQMVEIKETNTELFSFHILIFSLVMCWVRLKHCPLNTCPKILCYFYFRLVRSPITRTFGLSFVEAINQPLLYFIACYISLKETEPWLSGSKKGHR